VVDYQQTMKENYVGVSTPNSRNEPANAEMNPPTLITILKNLYTLWKTPVRYEPRAKFRLMKSRSNNAQIIH